MMSNRPKMTKAIAVRRVLILKALIEVNKPEDSTFFTKVLKLEQNTVGQLLKAMYNEGLLFRTYEKRMKWAFHKQRKCKTLCHEITDEGRKVLDDYEQNRIPYPAKLEAGDQTEARDDTSSHAKTHGFESGHAHESTGQEPQHEALWR